MEEGLILPAGGGPRAARPKFQANAGPVPAFVFLSHHRAACTRRAGRAITIQRSPGHGQGRTFPEAPGL
ncbi:MAG TPA: hypothetical protein VIM90_12880, partial [Arenimonas sp.]